MALCYGAHGDPGTTQELRGSTGRYETKAEMREAPSHFHDTGLVGIPGRQEHIPRSRQAGPRTKFGFQVSRREILIDAHRLARRFHLGPQDHIAAREAGEWKHRLLDRHVVNSGLGEAEAGQWLARHDPGRDLRDRHRRCLRDEGHRPARPRVDLEHVDLVCLDCVLHVHQADDAEPVRQQTGLPAQLALHRGRKGEGRQSAGGVTRVHPSLLDLLHYTGDVDVCAVGNGVHIDFDSAFQELVDQHRIRSRNVRCFHHVPPQRVDVLHELHRSPAENVGRPQENGIADARCHSFGLLDCSSRAIGRLPQAQLVQQLLEAFPILSQVNDVGRRTEDRDAGLFESGGQLERGLAAKLNDGSAQPANGRFFPGNLNDVLGSEGLEIQAIGSVVVRGDGFRVAVHHNCFVSGFGQSVSRVHAAVIELDALADAVRTSTEDEDFLALAGICLAARAVLELELIGGVEVRSESLEFRRTSVDPFEHGMNRTLLTVFSHHC